MKANTKDAMYWAAEGQRAGLGTAAAYVERRASDLFLDGRDAEAKAMRDLSRQIIALKSEVKNSG